MRFTGQVRVPEVDHPGVPATIVVEEGQTEVFLEGESLGRWSLYDVRASRLVSSAFSLSLAGEEITFIADEPVDFAYKGVDHMAGVWARYKSMTIPRRVVAVGRSRRGTTPSRISELREAMLQNLQIVGRGSSVLAPVASVTAMQTEPAPWTKRIDSYSNVPEPIATEERVETTPVADLEPEVDTEVEPAETAPATEAPVIETMTTPTETPEPENLPDLAPSPARALQLRPGPGLIRRQVEPSRSEESAASQVSPDSWEEAWEEPPAHEERYDDLPPDADLVLVEDEPSAEALPPSPAAPVLPPAGGEMPAEPEVAVAGGETDPPSPAAPVLLPAGGETETGHRELVVDLGHLETGEMVPLDEPSSLEPDLELLFAGAPAPEGERSGLLGAVRSAFARKQTSHEHQFVEAPGGIGIVRQICADCGYISIGVSD